ncbi:hypothetical protein GKR54_06945 [Providencia alcalifaciens]|uniref:hypothetical protein n=1 Tax=Providencia alcalifaciens TaxID=126385 RepID=UPI0012B5DF05|nr:hypothetical protein [Providencia alcalifaciens]MTC30813.1 hypothetical protein [Providencia alcalifaciens]
MIFLNTENGPIKLDKWDDIISKPSFMSKIPKGEHQLEKIIGYYEVKEKVHCSLSTCNQPHNKGYIVVTTENIETIIGNSCGKNIFGVEFEGLASDFDKFREHEERKSIISQGKLNLPTWRESLEALKFKGRDILWSTMNIERLCNSQYVGRTAANEFRNIAKNQNPDIAYDTTNIDKKLKSLLFEFNKKFRESGEAFDSVSVGKMQYIHVLLPENNLKNRYTSIYEDLKLLDAIEINEAPSPLLLEVSIRTGTIKTRIDELSQLFKDSKQFLQRKNLNLINEKLKKMENVSSEDRDSYLSFLNSI